VDRRNIRCGAVPGQGGRVQDVILPPVVQHPGVLRVHAHRPERQHRVGQLLRVQGVGIQGSEHPGQRVVAGRGHRGAVLHPDKQGRRGLLELVPERGRVLRRHQLPGGVRQPDARVPQRSQGGQDGNAVGALRQAAAVPVQGPRPQRNQLQDL